MGMAGKNRKRDGEQNALKLLHEFTPSDFSAVMNGQTPHLLASPEATQFR
jgi:hypothetical protein